MKKKITMTAAGNSLAMSSTKPYLSPHQQSVMRAACSQEIAIPELDMQTAAAFNDLALHILQDVLDVDIPAGLS